MVLLVFKKKLSASRLENDKISACVIQMTSKHILLSMEK